MLCSGVRFRASDHDRRNLLVHCVFLKPSLIDSTSICMFLWDFVRSFVGDWSRSNFLPAVRYYISTIPERRSCLGTSVCHLYRLCSFPVESSLLPRRQYFISP